MWPAAAGGSFLPLTHTSPHHCHPPQEFKGLEEAAFKVLAAAERAKAALEAKGEELAGIRGEYEAKKKEASGCR